MTDLEALRAENKTLLERTQATMRAHAEVVKARNEASEAVEVREAEIASYGVAWLAMVPPCHVTAAFVLTILVYFPTSWAMTHLHTQVESTSANSHGTVSLKHVIGSVTCKQYNATASTCWCTMRKQAKAGSGGGAGGDVTHKVHCTWFGGGGVVMCDVCGCCLTAHASLLNFNTIWC